MTYGNHTMSLRPCPRFPSIKAGQLILGLPTARRRIAVLLCLLFVLSCPLFFSFPLFFLLLFCIEALHKHKNMPGADPSEGGGMNFRCCSKKTYKLVHNKSRCTKHAASSLPYCKLQYCLHFHIFPFS